jgi:hypothetical protein
MHSNNLLDITKNFLTPDIVNKFSTVIGESTEKTQKGLKSVIPILLLGIVDKGQTTNGAETLINLVNKDSTDSMKVQNYSNEIYLTKGTDVIQSLFGNNLNSIVAKLGDSTGIRPIDLQKMLKIAAPLVMRFLGNIISREQLSTPGLVGFLEQQKSDLSNLLPYGLVGRFTGGGAEGHKKSPDRVKSVWIGLLIFALVVLVGLWWSSNKSFQYIESLASKNLPSVEHLPSYFKSLSPDVPIGFRFVKTEFKDGEAALKQGSQIELDQVASALKKFPSVFVTIESYSGFREGESEMRDLSYARAVVIKDQLVARGVNSARIDTLGMGYELKQRLNLIIRSIK